jgi:microcompartment protein CcmK/EutM
MPCGVSIDSTMLAVITRQVPTGQVSPIAGPAVGAGVGEGVLSVVGTDATLATGGVLIPLPQDASNGSDATAQPRVMARRD